MTTWDEAAASLAQHEAALVSVWGEPGRAHLALLDPAGVRMVAIDCPDGRYPSIGRLMPSAIRLERAIRDLHGLEPVGLPDTRPWLDHGDTPTDYRFLPVEGEHLHQVPVGPVHAGIIEPGHFRLTCDGESVVRLEQRLGYTHKGIDALMAGAAIADAARLAGRVSGDSTVAYASGFARAVEQALGIAPPPRAVWLRALMAELERLANHFGDIGAICNDASLSIMLAHCAMLRERVLRVASACFGHRLMMDAVMPGGVAADLADAAPLLTLVAELRADFRPLVALYDGAASLQDRTVGAGIVRPELAEQFAAGGYVGRASGRACDVRKWPSYSPYDALSFDVPVLTEGDVNARVWIRIREVEQSLNLLEQILPGLPPGRCASPCPQDGEDMRWPRGSAATCLPGSALRRAGCYAAICATRPGFSGRCWKPPSRATSSRIFPYATNPSTVPIRAMTCRPRTC